MRNMAPLMFVVEDDGWAISTPVETSTSPAAASAGSTASTTHIGPNNHLEIIEVDGTDFIASYRVGQQGGRAICASGKGPVLIHAHVTRPLSHSSADTQAYYRSAEDLAAEAAPRPADSHGRACSPSTASPTEKLKSWMRWS